LQASSGLDFLVKNPLSSALCNVHYFLITATFLEKNQKENLVLEKCASVYQHVYDSYFGAGRSIYQGAGYH